MNIINCTPHPINYVDPQGNKIDYPYSGQVPRVEVTYAERVVDGIVLSTPTFGHVIGLPESKEGTLYIVSRMIATACPFRNDLIVPCKYDRDENGKIQACRAFEVNS